MNAIQGNGGGSSSSDPGSKAGNHPPKRGVSTAMMAKGGGGGATSVGFYRRREGEEEEGAGGRRKRVKRETLPEIAERITVDALRPFLNTSLASAAKVSIYHVLFAPAGTRCVTCAQTIKVRSVCSVQRFRSPGSVRLCPPYTRRQRLQTVVVQGKITYRVWLW